MKKIEVSAAIINYKDKILCVQRGENKLEYISRKFEFPGGKIESKETPEETVVREVMEELKMEIKVIKPFLIVNHQYPDFHLTMHSYLCSTNSMDLQLSEHLSYKWLKLYELNDLDWAAADIPIVEKLIEE